MCSKVVFDTIEISSMITSFKSDNAILICVLFWSDNGGRLSPDSLGIANAVCIVVPLMLIAATPVGAISKTVGFSGLVIPCLKVFVVV